MTNQPTDFSPLLQRFSNNAPLRIALIGAMDQEIELLKNTLADCQSFSVAGYEFHQGHMHGVDVILLKSGIGKVNAAIGTAVLLHDFKPDCVINTGSAGGFDPSLTVGDVVISKEVLHHDADLTIFGYRPGQLPGMPPAFIPDPLLSDIAEFCINQIEGVATVHGLIATGDSFMNKPEKVEATRTLFPDIKAVEMEAAAIAQTCHRFEVPFIVIRALSDIAGKESNVSFKEFLETAATNSAKMVDAIVAEVVARHHEQTNRIG
ncbi:5'-methylthioadenosine/S-adenosylhomocysteine nucleosidase [Nitrincola tibetensis]|uniref:5'-methylthioadenosine/S-adenosylhomocysteine nucleosidase n=1 Tax=Nitrincola tibetensis TaxID=2219697 RepID=A0A364NQM0_9GAMM|nr:5'-methylthioadenosine/S-adenosylhomocysteine nucleosidase [Nitrincola tibetensis]RAU19366.1 5'-methylthioadenosine/S-adenosylhomocysteine nucleosidase [Nitrincola tibetensis]